MQEMWSQRAVEKAYRLLSTFLLDIQHLIRMKLFLFSYLNIANHNCITASLQWVKNQLAPGTTLPSYLMNSTVLSNCDFLFETTKPINIDTWSQFYYFLWSGLEWVFAMSWTLIRWRVLPLEMCEEWEFMWRYTYIDKGCVCIRIHHAGLFWNVIWIPLTWVPPFFLSVFHYSYRALAIWGIGSFFRGNDV